VIHSYVKFSKPSDRFHQMKVSSSGVHFRRRALEFSIILRVGASALLILWCANGRIARSQALQRNLQQGNGKPVSMRGKQTFASTCASCHGLDGRGGERAPNIAENPKVQRLSDAQIFHIVENGIPGAGMPAFHSLESSDIKAVVAYLRTLQGTKQNVTLPGNPDHGETIFFGKAGCSGCHMAAGKGGFIASDLTGYARTHNVDEIQNAIATPTPGGDRQARTVTVTTRAGEKYVGRIRNEDNFSLQLQALDGTFYFVAKSDLDRLEYNSQTLMPSDYVSTLGPEDLNDIVSYLMRMGNTGKKETPTKVGEWEE
jgi:cytochrome c oxidase cbb3-type subunit III